MSFSNSWSEENAGAGLRVRRPCVHRALRHVRSRRVHGLVRDTASSLNRTYVLLLDSVQDVCEYGPVLMIEEQVFERALVVLVLNQPSDHVFDDRNLVIE